MMVLMTMMFQKMTDADNIANKWEKNGVQCAETCKEKYRSIRKYECILQCEAQRIQSSYKLPKILEDMKIYHHHTSQLSNYMINSQTEKLKQAEINKEMSTYIFNALVKVHLGDAYGSRDWEKKWEDLYTLEEIYVRDTKLKDIKVNDAACIENFIVTYMNNTVADLSNKGTIKDVQICFNSKKVMSNMFAYSFALMIQGKRDLDKNFTEVKTANADMMNKIDYVKAMVAEVTDGSDQAWEDAMNAGVIDEDPEFRAARAARERGEEPVASARVKDFTDQSDGEITSVFDISTKELYERILQKLERTKRSKIATFSPGVLSSTTLHYLTYKSPWAAIRHHDPFEHTLKVRSVTDDANLAVQEGHCSNLQRVTRSYGNIIKSFRELHHNYIRTKSLYRQRRSQLPIKEFFNSSLPGLLLLHDIVKRGWQEYDKVSQDKMEHYNKHGFMKWKRSLSSKMAEEGVKDTHKYMHSLHHTSMGALTKSNIPEEHKHINNTGQILSEMWSRSHIPMEEAHDHVATLNHHLDSWNEISTRCD